MSRNLGIRTNLGETKAKEIWFKRTHMVIRQNLSPSFRVREEQLHLLACVSKFILFLA